MNPDDSFSSHRSLERRLLHLLQAVRDTRDTSARTELNSLLRENADARAAMPRLMVDEQVLISRLRDDSIVALLKPVQAPHSPLRTSRRWLSWRPLTAAAAGVLIGLFSASMVFGFGVRPLERVVSLFQESFENGPAPFVTGMPLELNQWSGDFSEIVSAQHEIKPMHGRKMLRVLSSEFEGKASSKPTRQGDLMLAVDVRPFLREANGGEVVIMLSAVFNAMPFPDSEALGQRLGAALFSKRHFSGRPLSCGAPRPASLYPTGKRTGARGFCTPRHCRTAAQGAGKTGGI